MACRTDRGGTQISKASRLKESLDRVPAVVYGLLWLSWFILLWQLSSRALPPMPETPYLPFRDKLLHWGYFALGGFLITITLRSLRRLAHPLFLIALLSTGALTGLLDEWHQSWIPGRMGNDLGDFLADCLGYGSGIGSYFLLVRAAQARH